jgi:hypothetical protein
MARLPTLGHMRDIETIDADLRFVSRAWRVARVLCEKMPNTALIDQLLDERADCRMLGALRGTRSA